VAITLTRSDLSRRLAALRQQHDPPLNQQEAAEVVGLSLRQYGRLERGEADATLATIRKIADAYDVEPHFLTGAVSERFRPAAQAPGLGDLARLEAKLDLLLAHFDLLTVESGFGADAPDLAALLTSRRDRPPAPPARRRDIARSHR